METVYVVLCGTDVLRAQVTLQTSVTIKDHAWNTKYSFACTTARCIDEADDDLLRACHVIVLCGSAATLPGNYERYHNKPVLALGSVPHSSVTPIQDEEFFYGKVSLDELCETVIRVGLTPSHVLYDNLLHCLTPRGECAIQRAFWIMDKDCDGTLRRDELLRWRRMTESTSYDDGALARSLRDWRAAVRSAHEVGDEAAKGEGDAAASNSSRVEEPELTLRQFTEVHRVWLSQGLVREAWATLHVLGTHPDGLPYTWNDLHSVRVDASMNTYLSTDGVQFFANVYKLRYLRQPRYLWSFTPGCPWRCVDGFVCENIPLDKFIEYWKYMALERRETVIQYARYWGYRGETSYLFVRRHCRAARDVAIETLPDTIQVLLIGSRGCGKKSLSGALTGTCRPRRTPEEQDTRAVYSEAESNGGGGCSSSSSSSVRTYSHTTRLHHTGESVLHVRTTTFFVRPRRRGSEEEPLTMVYTTVCAEKALTILCNENLNRTIDVAALCCDVSNFLESSRYLMEMLDEAQRTRGCVNLPLVLILTKSDTVDVESLLRHADMREMRRFAAHYRLVWPPLKTSVRQQTAGECAALNDYIYELARYCDRVEAAPKLTMVRLLRRLTLVAMVSVSLVGVLQRASAYVRRRWR